MKIRQGFVMKEIEGKTVVVATGDAKQYFSGMITLNETGKKIFTCLQNDTTEVEIANEIVEEYNIQKYVALSDINTFISKLKIFGIIEE